MLVHINFYLADGTQGEFSEKGNRGHFHQMELTTDLSFKEMSPWR